MPLKSGIYVIHENVTGMDDIFASGVGIEIPILGLPLQNGTPNIQRWEVRLQDDGSYTITKPPYLPGPPGGFGVDEPNLDVPVKFKSEISTWQISAANEEESAYVIRMLGGPIGANLTVVLRGRGSEEKELVLQAFPVMLHPPPPPSWIFRPVLED